MTETIRLATNRFGEALICENCWSTETGTWRRSIGGTSILCNACGLFQRTKKKSRPAYLFGKTKRNSNSNVRHNALVAVSQERRRTSPMAMLDAATYAPWTAQYSQQQTTQQRPAYLGGAVSAPDVMSFGNNSSNSIYHHNIYSNSASPAQLASITVSPTLSMLNDALHRHQRRMQEEAVIHEVCEIITSPTITNNSAGDVTAYISPPVYRSTTSTTAQQMVLSDPSLAMLLSSSAANDTNTNINTIDIKSSMATSATLLPQMSSTPNFGDFSSNSQHQYFY